MSAEAVVLIYELAVAFSNVILAVGCGYGIFSPLLIILQINMVGLSFTAVK